MQTFLNIVAYFLSGAGMGAFLIWMKDKRHKAERAEWKSLIGESDTHLMYLLDYIERMDKRLAYLEKRVRYLCSGGDC